MEIWLLGRYIGCYRSDDNSDEFDAGERMQRDIAVEESGEEIGARRDDGDKMMVK